MLFYTKSFRLDGALILPPIRMHPLYHGYKILLSSYHAFYELYVQLSMQNL